MARVGFIGTGEIAAAMVRGLRGLGHDIALSPRNAATAARLAAEEPGVRILENAEVVAQSDVVFLCLLARAVDDVLPGLPFQAGQAVISVMVDVSLSRLQTFCAPATDIAITIPLPQIATGGCPLPVYPASPALQAVFGGRNPVLTLPDERALNAHLGATALCSPMLAQLRVAADWLAGFTGDRAQAEAYVTGMIGTMIGNLAATGGLDGTMAALSTEGGLNATLRRAMESAETDLREGLDGFRERLGLESSA